LKRHEGDATTSDMAGRPKEGNTLVWSARYCR
jgi:hypothetical protein